MVANRTGFAATWFRRFVQNVQRTNPCIWVCKPGLFGLRRKDSEAKFRGLRSVKPVLFKSMTLPIERFRLYLKQEVKYHRPVFTQTQRGVSAGRIQYHVQAVGLIMKPTIWIISPSRLPPSRLPPSRLLPVWAYLEGPQIYHLYFHISAVGPQNTKCSRMGSGAAFWCNLRYFSRRGRSRASRGPPWAPRGRKSAKKTGQDLS